MPYEPTIPHNLHLVAPENQRPQFQHDCNHCVFLGRFRGIRGPADLYFHGGSQKTTIARFDSEGRNYSSGEGFAFGHLDDLTEARLRAQKLELAAYDVYEALANFTPGTSSEDELIAALPQTVEWRAYQAVLDGKQVEAVDMLRAHVVELQATSAELFQKYGGPSSPFTVEERLKKIVSMMRGFPEKIATDALRVVTPALLELLSDMDEAEWLARPDSEPREPSCCQ